jgi:hypothetical protein
MLLTIIGRSDETATSQTYVDFWHDTNTDFCATSNTTGGYSNSIFEKSEPLKVSGSDFRNFSS